MTDQQRPHDAPNPSDPPLWSLTSLYPAIDSPAFQADKLLLRERVIGLERYLDAHEVRAGAASGAGAGNATVLEGLLERLEGAHLTMLTLRSYLAASTAVTPSTKPRKQSSRPSRRTPAAWRHLARASRRG